MVNQLVEPVVIIDYIYYYYEYNYNYDEERSVSLNCSADNYVAKDGTTKINIDSDRNSKYIRFISKKN